MEHTANSEQSTSRPAFRSLRFRINAALVFTAMVIALFFGVILYPFEMRRQNAEMKRVYQLLETVYQQKKEDLANELFARQQRALAASLSDLLGIDGLVGVSVHLPGGGTYMATADAFRFPLAREAMETLSGRSVFERIELSGRSYGLYSRQIRVIGRDIGYLRMFYDLSGLQKETRLSVIILVGLLAVTVLLMTLLLNTLLTGSVIDPVSRLRDAMQRVQQGGLGETVDLPSADEIGEMGQAFNDMSKALEDGQNALKQAEEKYRSIFEDAIEGIFRITSWNGRYLAVNPSMAGMLGYKSPEALIDCIEDIGRQQFVDPEDARTLETLLSEHGRVVGFETHLLRKDGGRIWVSISVHGIPGEGGEIPYYEGFFIDITERRQREKAEKERESAEAESWAKSVFLANMSHEIRTPINAILGFSNLLGTSLTDPRQKNYLDSIKSSSDSLMSLINDILDLSKIEAGKMEITYAPARLRSLFGEIDQVFSFSAARKGLDFEIDIAGDIPDTLMLDEARLRQVMFNLVGNALKFTDTGSIRIAARMEAADTDSQINLIIRVTDTGIGIEPDALDTIFESFTQQSGLDTRVYGGTGLGLSISKHLLELMGGAIEVESAPGTGTTFVVTLHGVTVASGAATEAVSDGQKEGIPIALKPATILVADDIELNRQLICEIVNPYGLTVIEATDGKTAVELARQYRPELILMDLKMPVQDGFEAAATLKEIPETRDIPIIAITAADMAEIREKLAISRFAHYLLRPFEAGALLNVLQGFIGMQPPPDKDADIGKRIDDIIDRILGDDRFIRAPDGMRDKLLGSLKAQWLLASRSQRITDIENFGHQIQAVGDQSGMSALTDFGDMLIFYVSSFDIDAINQTMAAFETILIQTEQIWTTHE